MKSPQIINSFCHSFFFVCSYWIRNNFNRFYFLCSQLTFKCSGSSQPPPSTVDSHVDPHTGVQMQEVTATISKDLVFEYFGKLPFKCDCHAWSPRGKAKSQSATIEVACKYYKLICSISYRFYWKFIICWFCNCGCFWCISSLFFQQWSKITSWENIKSENMWMRVNQFNFKKNGKKRIVIWPSFQSKRKRLKLNCVETFFQ